MSLSDKFYEGLSAPLPVASAQMPTDLVPYAGGPLDALEQHKQKYRQIDYMNRLSDRTSRRLLKQLAEAEVDSELEVPEEYDMDKLSFVGSNPISRRQYLLSQISNLDTNTEIEKVSNPVGDTEALDNATEEIGAYEDGSDNIVFGTAPKPPPMGGTFEDGSPNPVFSDEPLPLPNSNSPTRKVPAPSSNTRSAPTSIKVPSSLRKAPVSRVPRKQAPSRVEPSGYSTRYNDGDTQARFVGKNKLKLINSGQLAQRLQEFSSAYDHMKKDPRYIGPKPDNRGFMERMGDTLYNYGTRAARGLSTGAQMGASYLYDVADRNNYLDKGTFLGDALGQDNREALNREMARINAGLYHSYGGDERQDANAKLYADRLRGIDTELGLDDIQARTDLLERDAFKEDTLDEQMKRYEGRNYTDKQMQDMRRSAGETFDNYYGYEGNVAGTPSLRDDLTGTSFRNAMNELRDGSFFNPAKEQTRLATLQEMMSKNPVMYRAIKDAFGEEAAQANIPLAEFAAKRLSRDLTSKRQLVDAGTSPEDFDNVYETDDQQLSRYEQTRDFTSKVLDTMSEADRGNFISMMNPRVVRRSNQLSQLFSRNPEEALRQINEMDPREARFLMDQISMLSKYVSPDEARQKFDPQAYQIREDRDNFLLPDLGGSDLINPALQQIGAGGNYEDMTGDARDRVFFYNSMRDAPRGQSYMVDDGYLGNTYFNPITGEENYEFGTDIGNLFSTAPSTRAPLPRRFHKRMKQVTGRLPTYTGR